MFLSMYSAIVVTCLLVISLNGFNASESIANITSCDYGFYLYNGVCEECGITEAKPNPKIVGGIVATAHSWPAQALIIQSYKGNYNFRAIGGSETTIAVQFRCGGTLINRDTIVTAAHCIAFEFDYFVNGFILNLDIVQNEYYKTYESMFDVYLGVHELEFLRSNSSQLPSSVRKLSVSKIIVHPKFDTINYLNDIALLKLSEPVEMNSFVQAACLPDKKSINFPAINKDSYASGWGTVSEGGPAPNELHNVRLRTYNPILCYSVLPVFYKDWNLQICAGNIGNGKDTCQGDSGGGLYVYEPNLKKYVVSGVTSYGDGCGRPWSPGIYTRISAYLDWINAN